MRRPGSQQRFVSLLAAEAKDLSWGGKLDIVMHNDGLYPSQPLGLSLF